MTRVLHIMADGAAGGGPTVVQTLCRSLGEAGHEAQVVTQAKSHLAGEAPRAGLRTFEVDFSRRSQAWQASRALQAVLEETRPDIMLAHGARSTLPAALIGRGSRPPLVHIVHGLHYTRKTPPARLLGRAVERYCVARSDRTVFVAHADQVTAKRHRLLGDARHQVIHNGVAVPPGLARSPGDRAFDIVFIGRLHAQKDPLLLPDILLAMRPRRPSLLIVAGGDLEPALRARIEATGVGGQIVFAGPQPRYEALRLLAQARVCVLPSLWEGLPVSLAEAMLLQVAVVASDIPGNREIVCPGQTGLLAPPGNAHGFAAGITRLLTSDSLWRTLTAAAAERARTQFSARSQAEAYLALFDSLLGHRPVARNGSRDAA